MNDTNITNDNLVNPNDQELPKFLAGLKKEVNNLNRVDQPYLADWFDLPVRLVYSGQNYLYTFEDPELTVGTYFVAGMMIRVQVPESIPTIGGAYFNGYCLGVDYINNKVSLVITGTQDADGIIPVEWRDLGLDVSVAIKPSPQGHTGKVDFNCIGGLDSNGADVGIIQFAYEMAMFEKDYRLSFGGQFNVLATPTYVDLYFPIPATYPVVQPPFSQLPLFTTSSEKTLAKLTSNGGAAVKIVECQKRTSGHNAVIRIQTYDGSTITGICELSYTGVRGRNASNFYGYLD